MDRTLTTKGPHGKLIILLVDQETVEELESTSSRLRETEHTLTCTKTVLQRAAAEREEQRHLVQKHVETELKLAQQAKKLLTVRWVSRVQ